MISEIFLFNLALAFSALGLACLGVCYKSKCKNINMCYGAIVIDRDISAEVEEDKAGLEMPATTFNMQHESVV